ncbi:MAG: AAA family ATPase [Candidatus Omnitrophota bacterium]|jgi:DNA polymerase-3 subunit delta'|nr:MAG: AAA family ATPase [Candidatus Omnitrophota bacterium]
MPWNDVECHPSVRKNLQRALFNNMLGGTNLIYGPTGAGQVAVARALAQTVLCETKTNDFCDVCPTCIRVRNRAYADLFEFRPQKATYLINQLREMQYSAVMQPYAGDKKIFLLHDAHRMNKESANSLLKLLEEPYPHNLFLLLTDNISGILPTIVSRCRKIRLAPLPIDDLSRKLTANLPARAAETLARAAGGLPEMANALQASHYLEIRDIVLEWIKNVRERGSNLISMADEMAKKTQIKADSPEDHPDPNLYFLDSPDLTKREKDRLLEKYCVRKHLTVLLRLIRDGMATVSGMNHVPFLNEDKREEIERLWNGETPQTMIVKFEKTLDTLEGIERNLYMPLLLSDLLLVIRRGGEAR